MRSCMRLMGSLQAFRLETAQEGFLMMRVLQRDVLRHLALAYGVEQRLIHGLHAGGAVGGDHGVDLVGFLLADEVADGGVHVHDLEHGDGGAVERGDEHLADRGLQHERQLGADLALLVGGEGVDHALDGVGGAGGVQRGEHQLRHLGSVDGGADGLGVAHLAEQDDVGAFAHG